ncbi:MAG TPA: Cdc6/Cdc18 family protein [Thermoplasmata archaeon]|nr:Cdc6/Cdc18 family protein [Thermoplasmata archaeon]
MKRILTSEETLDPAFVPPKLVRRETELGLLSRRYRESLEKGVACHYLLTGGIGSGKTALAQRLGEDLQRKGRLGGFPLVRLYVNCWRRSSDRTVLLELLRGVGVSLPDRGYSLAEMLDVFEQGIRRAPRHLFVILDEVSALVRQETKLLYLLTRSREVGLGSISLFLVAPEDVLPYLDAASRSSFGVTHRLQLQPYDAAALTDILASRAELALRPGSYTRDVLEQVARAAAATGDARFALELLGGAARAAEQEEREEIRAEDVRAAKGSIYPTLTETKLEELPRRSLLILLALARSLRGPKSQVPSEKVRQAYQAISEEYDEGAVGRIQFWRTIKELEREGLIQVEPGRVGDSHRLSMDEVPASFLEMLLESRVPRARARKA